MSDLERLLRSLGLIQYAEIFLRQEVDIQALRLLADADFAELGIPLGPRRKIQAALIEADAVGTTPTEQAAQVHPTVPAAERRQLTVLFCDLVGSTAFSAAVDAELLRHVMAAYHAACTAVIESYEGEVAQYLGDGVMAYFGWPLAHEDDAERALRAALDLVDRVGSLALPARVPEEYRRMDVRIGVATGPVVVGDSGGGEPGASRLAVGETPNLAVRLQVLAGPGSIVIGAATRQLAGPRFEYRDLGRHTLKGIVDTVQAWQVHGLADAESRFEATRGESLTPLVGREEELQAMLRRWHLAMEGEAQVILISGEPGIGKSRLTQVLRQQVLANSGECRLLRYQCSPFHENSALYPFAEQLARVAGFGREDEARQKLDKLDALLGETAPALAGDAALLASLLGLPLDRYPPMRLSAGRQRERTLEVLVEYLVLLAVRSPVLVVVEDVHWIDTTSRELLDLWVREAERRHGLRVLFVITYRPEFSAASWSGRPHVAQLSLARLRSIEASQLVSQAAGGRHLPDTVRARIISRTDGVPLFVEELTRTVIESGVLREVDGRFVLEGVLPDVAIPGTLRDSLIARLDRLSPVKETAQIGACIGRAFGYRLLAAVSPLSEFALRDALEQLVGAGLAHVRGRPPEAEYVFKHALVQEAAYESLLHSRRQQLHLRIAQVLADVEPELARSQPEVLAWHCDRADLAAEAIRHWLSAGRLATARFALADALTHLEHGLAELRRLPESAERDRLSLELHAALGIAYLAKQGWAAEPVYGHFHRALELSDATGSDRHLVAILAGLATHVMNRGRPRESLQWAERASEEASARKSRELEILASLLAAMSNFWLGRLDDAEDRIARTLELADPGVSADMVRVINHDPRTRVLVARSHIEWLRGFPARAAATYAIALDNARRLGHAFDLGWTIGFGCFLASVHRDAVARDELGAALEQHVASTGTSFFEHFFLPFVIGNRAEVQGDWETVIERYQMSNEFWQAQGGQLALPCTRLTVASAMARLGRVRDAWEELDASLEQAMRPGWEERLFLPEILRMRGWLHARSGEFDAATACFNESLGEARLAGMRAFELRTGVTYGRMLLGQGKRHEAVALVEPLHAAFTEGRETADQREARELLDACR
jgi:class 3 adenylate cyclase/tetratricopeptide (TPR) repeat protein